MSGIDITAYPFLNTFSVLASAGITTVNTTTVVSPFLYGSSPTATYTGDLQGAQGSSAAAGTAQTQLGTTGGSPGTLIRDINDYTSSIGAPVNIPIRDPVTLTITLSPNRNYNQSAITFASGTNIVLDGSGIANPQFFITSTSAITFTGLASITLINGASSNNVFWLANSAAITFSDPSPQPSFPGIFIAGTSISFASASQIDGRVYAKAAISFSGTSSVNGTNVVDCYAKGTLILTTEGFVPVENIRLDNKVISRGTIHNNEHFVKDDCDLKTELVTWVGKLNVLNPDSKSRPICIKKNAFGENLPFDDLYVSPGHRLLLNGEMVVARDIINDTTIYQDNECGSVEYYHFECENHIAVVANGILAETYLEVDERRRVFDLN